MPRVSLTALQAGSTDVATLNANFDAIEDAMEGLLSKSGQNPNTMSAVLDMNSQQIINVGAPTTATSAVRKQDLDAALLASLPSVQTSDLDMGGHHIINVAAPLTQTSAVRLVDLQAASVVNPLPTQTGNAGKFLGTNGSTTSWNTVNTSAAAVTSTAVGAVSATNVQTAIAQLDALVATKAGTTDLNTTVNTAVAQTIAYIGWQGMRVIGADVANNSGAPSTAVDISCLTTTVVDPVHGYATTVNSASNYICDYATTGVGGSDTGGLAPNQPCHYYFILNPGVQFGVICSQRPPSLGPIFPAGYTQYAYIGTVMITGSGALPSFRIKGRTLYLNAGTAVLAAGAALSLTPLVLTTVVPAVALETMIQVQYFGGSTNASGQAQMILSLGTNPSQPQSISFFNYQGSASSVHACQGQGGLTVLPNVNQTIYFKTQTVLGSAFTTSFDLMGYTLPNGG